MERTLIPIVASSEAEAREIFNRIKARLKLEASYGLGLMEYQKILEAQGGMCAICRRPPARVQLHIDHHHQCGRKTAWKRLSVRGLLCSNCNRGIFREDPRVLRAAAAYFEAHRLVCPARSKA